jgi:hypothetical protein
MRVFLSVALILAAAVLPAAVRQQNPYLGAWNLTGTGQDSANVYWLEIKDSGGTLSGMFLNRTSSPFALAGADRPGIPREVRGRETNRAPHRVAARARRGPIGGTDPAHRELDRRAAAGLA